MTDEAQEPALTASETKTIEVTKVGGKVFRITVPAGSRTTFGPWSPIPSGTDRFSGGDKALVGTLRIYAPGPKTSDNLLAVFSGVEGFRDLSIDYAERVSEVVGSVVWNSDKDGYQQEVKVQRKNAWDDGGEVKVIAPGQSEEES